VMAVVAVNLVECPFFVPVPSQARSLRSRSGTLSFAPETSANRSGDIQGCHRRPLAFSTASTEGRSSYRSSKTR
jgi:hypothetical protein